MASREQAARPTRVLSTRRLLPFLLVVVVVVSALTLFGDTRELGEALRRFDWWLSVPILALTLWNYGWRFVKWRMYLRLLGVEIGVGLSLRIFVAGFAMSITPGKVGELVKAVYVRRATGAPIAKTTATIAAERITDGIAMLLLAAVGAAQFAYGRTFLALGAVAVVVGVVLLQRPEFLSRQLSRAEHLPLVGRFVEHAVEFVHASGALFSPRTLARAVGLGVISWAGECLAFFLILIGLGLDASWHLLLVAIFVLAVSSIAGGVSMLPGGLGVAEAGIAGLLLLLVDDPEMSRSTAATATILVRFATLWFAVLIGVVALVGLERTLPRAEERPEPLQS